jgi:hypothetical protein
MRWLGHFALETRRRESPTREPPPWRLVHCPKNRTPRWRGSRRCTSDTGLPVASGDRQGPVTLRTKLGSNREAVCCPAVPQDQGTVIRPMIVASEPLPPAVARTHKPYLSLASASAIIAAALAVIHVNSGDATIYLTYFKRFFDLPFSYAPGEVSFGATSPLHVVLNAPIALLFGNAFVTPSRVVAGALLLGGVSCLATAVSRSGWNLPLAAALVVVNGPLMLATSQLFETALAFALIALVYFAVRTDRALVATMGAGLLPLARPETVLMSLFVYGWVLLRSPNRQRTVLIVLASLAPALLYFGYMLVQTGGIIPSSVAARVLTAQEGHASPDLAVVG